MKIRSRLTATALIVTIGLFGLAACGSDDSDTDTEKDDTSTSKTEDTTEESDGDKPSKDEVIAGYAEYVNAQAGGGLPESVVTDVVSCFVDEVYDDASAQTLQAIADGDPTGVDPADAQLFTDASTACMQSLG
ncbi:MAG: hypothetical protein QM597_01970 [Aeromicrobium sp.]|uniref:hypothetical protein n=1 Tax=Aeromicrobium sp. TaxID=1871063 RepID=UPI0039E2A911